MTSARVEHDGRLLRSTSYVSSDVTAVMTLGRNKRQGGSAIQTAQRCHRGTGGPRAPLVLSLSMWLTEKKVGACCGKKIVHAVGKIARVGGGGLEQPVAEGQHFAF
jgi:hypothetical protein